MLHAASRFPGLDPATGSWEHGLLIPSEVENFLTNWAITGFSMTLIHAVSYLFNYTKTQRIADLCTALQTKTTESWAYFTNVKIIKFKWKCQQHLLYFFLARQTVTHSSSKSQYRYRHTACYVHHSLYHVRRATNVHSTDGAWEHECSSKKKIHVSIKNNNTWESIHDQQLQLPNYKKKALHEFCIEKSA
jgi:hypothetical protein